MTILRFGVFPLGMAAGPDGIAAGPPDDFERLGAALGQLQGDRAPLLARLHVVFEGVVEPALAQVAQFAGIGAAVDLSLDFHDPGGDVAGWCRLVEQVVERHGRQVGSIGITNEANLVGVPFGPDGAYPHALEALVDGVLQAAASRNAGGATAAIGFAAAAGGSTAFWDRVRERGGPAFADAVDFAGLTMYPGVFGEPRVGLSELGAATAALLRGHRAALDAAGVPSRVPIRICESGWPTGSGHTEDEQARALETIVRTVADLAGEVGITHWELFTLRDADSSRDELFHRFGVLRDDYTPKPAFAVLRRLIAELAPPADQGS
jgi:hypothetical protein